MKCFSQSQILLGGMLTCLLVGCSFSPSAWAATPQSLADRMEQLEEARRRDLESRMRNQAEMVRLKKQGKRLARVELPAEELSFYIRELVLEGEDAGHFPWAQEYLDYYAGQNIGMEGINLLIKKLNDALLDKGFVTSRIYIRQQDLTSEILYLTVSAGKIAKIAFEEEDTWGTWVNAFPLRSGKILNIRDIEQGLEQMRRIPSQDVDIDIQPALEAGYSNLIIKVKRSKPWRWVTTFDDSGTKDTGKNQLTTALGIDNLLSLNDMLYISYNKDAARNGEQKGTRADSFYYSLPLGRQSLSVNWSQNKYHQTVRTAVWPMEYSGESEQFQVNLTHLLHRNQLSKTNLEFSILKKKRKSFINQTEITVQRQETTAMRVGVTRRQYWGKSVLDGALRYQRGVGWFGAKPGSTDNIAGSPTTLYNLYTADLNLNAPFQLANLKGRYSLNIRGQYTNSLLYGSEFFSVGGRYTVRGFDGEQTLSAEKGYIIRQELAFPIIQKSQQLYTALDYGRVSGPSTEYLLGKEITGLALGIRGGFKHFQYDFFVGWPIKKPEGFKTEKQTIGFYVTAEF